MHKAEYPTQSSNFLLSAARPFCIVAVGCCSDFLVRLRGDGQWEWKDGELKMV